MSFFLILLAGVLILLAGLFLFQSRLVYFPMSKIDGSPRDMGLAYEDVRLTASDGVELHAWLVLKENARGAALFCHGNAGNISHRLETISLLNGLGLSVFIFDYRGYGQSGGKPSEQGTYRDAWAAWQYLTQERGTAPKDIVVWGRSLGGPIAAWLARKADPGALILESTFTSLPDIGAKLYPFLPVRLIARIGYNTEEYLSGVHCPVLVVHSPDDRLASFEFGQRLFKAANEPKEFLEITGGHNNGFLVSGPTYVDGVDGFLKRRAQM
ncbi:MAG: alpha/beta hydrolase [Thermodesulfobacteriota bacterium]|nr:alpha/beta hydrolase [Thermodesulfobacteriota bacterium]